MNSLSEAESQLLALILELSHGDTNKILNRKAVSVAAGMSVANGEKVLKRLTSQRLIRYILFGSLCITEAGIIVARRAKPAPKIEVFLSYRRSDSQDIVERMFDRLAADFGAERVFHDVSSGIPGGATYVEHLRKSLSGSSQVLIIIGPTWLEAGEQARPRLFEDADVLRLEIETALGSGCVVVPVCVGGAQPPKADSLPESIRALAGKQVVHVRRGADFHPDMDKLIRSMTREKER